MYSHGIQTSGLYHFGKGINGSSGSETLDPMVAFPKQEMQIMFFLNRKGFRNIFLLIAGNSGSLGWHYPHDISHRETLHFILSSGQLSLLAPLPCSFSFDVTPMGRYSVPHFINTTVQHNTDRYVIK